MAETLDGPVGLRFRKQKVKSNAGDQAKVIGLLAKISKAQGGKKEEWATPPLSGANGDCPSFVSDAIWDFQFFWKSKGHFRNIDGVVDPGMNTLAQLNLLAAGVTPPAPPPGPSTPFKAPLKQNPNITLDGTKATERKPPIHPAEWVRRTQATFDTICSSALGRQIVQGRRKKTTVEPFLTDALDASAIATSEGEFISFTADNFDGKSEPGCRADEMLLHELIHGAENHFGLYDDVASEPLKYHRSDFLTVIGTNVYSSSLGRGLRADHDKFRPMPPPYAADPGEHERVWHGNYQKAFNNNRALFNLFRNQPAAWNPFKLFTP